MPLMHGKSKKAFEHNLKAEMHAGKPQDQSLAIAYSIKRKAQHKKMAEGGSVKDEKRPMPEQMHEDKAEVMRNNSKASLKQAGWTDQPTVTQAQSKPRVQAIKHPKIASSGVFQTKLYNQEDDLMDSDAPASDKEQPDKDYNEKKARKSGPDVPALHMKKMAKGGMINNAVSMHEAEEEDDDQKRPPMADYMEDHDAAQYAEGGEVDNEAEIEHAASIAAAIMAKRKKEAIGAHSDSDIDHEMYMAEGGEVDLSENADEEPNHEDQLSFNALKKENYSESDALDDLNQPMDSNEHSPEHEEEDVNDRSIVSAVRRKMKIRSAIVK
jgi:hypothetical protein